MPFTKTAFFLLAFFSFTFHLNAQQIVPFYTVDRLDDQYLDSLKKEFGKKKKLPKGYETQALLALSHYPELVDVKIRFKLKSGGAPFISRPTVWSTFFRRRKKRNYLILIRTNPHAMFDPILMKNMPFNAQVGVLGHEIGHTANYTQRGLRKMMQVVFGNLSYKFLDKFEFETDRRTIAHGMGFQLFAWSSHAIKTLRVNEPAAPKANDKLDGMMQRERYMRPSTIKKEMLKMDLYKDYINVINELPETSGQ